MPMHEVGATRSVHSRHRHSTGYGSVHIRRALREPIGAGAVLGGVRALHVPLFATATPIKHQGSTGNLQGNDTGNTTGSVNQSHTQRHTNCIHTFNAAKDMSSSQAGRWYSPSTAAGGVSPPTSRSSKNSAPRSLTWDANRPENVQSSCTGSHGTDAYGFVHHVSVNTNSATYTATANSHVHTHELGKPPAQHTEPPPKAPPADALDRTLQQRQAVATAPSQTAWCPRPRLAQRPAPALRTRPHPRPWVTQRHEPHCCRQPFD